jgi:hypothetical protein
MFGPDVNNFLEGGFRTFHTNRGIRFLEISQNFYYIWMFMLFYRVSACPLGSRLYGVPLSVSFGS